MGQPAIHFEIGCGDSEKTQEFFSKLFGWEMQQVGPEAMINTTRTEISSVWGNRRGSRQ